MIELASFQRCQLKGGFEIAGIDLTDEPLIDAVGREAIAHTTIIDRQFSITIRSGLSEEELSVTLYHEILEAATVAATHPPESLRMFNEGNFERAAYETHLQFGEVSPENLDKMLQSYGFEGQ